MLPRIVLDSISAIAERKQLVDRVILTGCASLMDKSERAQNAV